MKIIGRQLEEKELRDACDSPKSELIAVYGRRRVGKTYLIDNTFENQFDFKHTGLSPIELKELKDDNKNKTFLELQLRHFYHSLKLFGMKENKIPTDWLEAFFMLENLLLSKKTPNKKQIIFIDELPWLDTKKSFFVTAFEAFWNGWAEGKDILVIVCGSATSWMTNKLINNTGGLYGRVTKEIKLSPLSLKECEMFLLDKRVTLSRYDITQAYMIFGGIPYYLNYLDANLSLPQNIDHIFFAKNSILKREFNRLFSATFDDDDLAKEIVLALSKKRIGYTRDELVSKTKCKDGERFSKAINALLVSDYIVKYKPIQEKESLYHFRLIDPFCLFYLSFIKDNETTDDHYFTNSFESSKINAWRGLAFENVCYNHIQEIKTALGISGVAISHYSFVANDLDKGAQIDLVLERKDNIVHLCEMKFLSNSYKNDKEEHLRLMNKMDVLKQFLKKKQAIRNVLITTYGIANSDYRWDYQNIITLDDLFK